jgi:hypothetical protein
MDHGYSYTTGQFRQGASAPCSELFGVVWSCSELAKLRRRGLGNLEVFDALA